MRLHGQKVFRPALPIGLFPYSTAAQGLRFLIQC